MKHAQDPAASLDDVADLLAASTNFDLSVDPGLHHDLLDHSLQTAHALQVTHPDDIELQIAGLVHDLGHMLPPYRDEAHADVAAAFLRPVLGHRIAELVRLHVPAKRYLVTTDSRYRHQLDQGSVVSLEHQGGDLSPEELEAFESDPLAADALTLRRADEAGKIAGADVPGLDTWLAVLRSHNFAESGAITEH
jgi:predicted HD phosphohydrolase